MLVPVTLTISLTLALTLALTMALTMALTIALTQAFQRVDSPKSHSFTTYRAITRVGDDVSEDMVMPWTRQLS